MATYDSMAFDESFVAAVDFSGSQYKFVKAGSVVGEVSGGTGASLPNVLGVLQNDPAAGEIACVRIFGVSKLSCCAAVIPGAAASAIAMGDCIACGSNGKGYHTGPTGSLVNAMALESLAAGAGGTIEVFVLQPWSTVAYDPAV